MWSVLISWSLSRNLLPGDRIPKQRHGDSWDSSSIRRNSSDVGDKEDSGEEMMAEVQSPYKGGPLNNMTVLEEVLPIRWVNKFVLQN